MVGADIYTRGDRFDEALEWAERAKAAGYSGADDYIARIEKRRGVRINGIGHGRCPTLST